MLCISVEEFLFWKKKQLSKGGDQQSFAVLLDCIGGISTSDLNLKSINPKEDIHLKKNLEFLESVWDDHLLKSCPIQYLCGITFWRDLKLKVDFSPSWVEINKPIRNIVGTPTNKRLATNPKLVVSI